MDIVHLDFETYYKVGDFSLSKQSTQEYILDDRFEAIGVAVQWPDDRVPVWHTGRELDRQMDRLRDSQSGVIVSAFNCVFDASILAWRYHVFPAELACPMSMARSCGLGLVSGLSLDAVGKLAQAAGHNVPTKGHEVVLASGKRRADFTAGELRDYGRYCVDDTRILKGVFDALARYLSPEELLFQSSILRCYTERPFVVNRGVVMDELARVRAKRATALTKLCASVGVPDEGMLLRVVGSDKKFAEALELFGAVVPRKKSKSTGKQTNAFAKTDPGMLELLEHPTPEVAALAEARLGLKGSSEVSRCLSMLDCEALGPLPIPLQIHGAHTGRLSGGGAGSKINVQNFSSGRKEGQSKALKQSLQAPPGRVVTAADSSQIEVRCMDYISGDRQGLAEFAAGVCPYASLAIAIWPAPGVTAADVKRLAKAGDELWGARRQLCKVIRLSMMYGIGAKKFQEYADTQGGIKLTYPEAKVYSAAFKSSKPLVPKLWQTYDRVLRALAAGEGVEFGGPDGKLLVADPRHSVLGQKLPGIRMPDGTFICYPGIEFVDVEELVDVLDDTTGEVVGQRRETRNKCRFHTRKGRSSVENWTWGGTACENGVQSFAFSVIKHQTTLLRYPLALNEHDCNIITSSVDDAADALSHLRWTMEQAPPWAPGLPLACEVGQAGNVGDVVKR